MPRRVVRRAKRQVRRSTKRISRARNVNFLRYAQETHLNPYDFVLIGFLLLIGLYLLSIGLGGTGASISPITLGVTGAAVSPTGHVTAPPVKWWDADWNYRIPVKVKELAQIEHNDYIVEATVDTRALVDAGKIQANCADVRVIGEDNKVLDHEVDSTNACDRSDTKIRFRANVSSGSDNTLAYIYYGNTQASALGTAVPWWKSKTSMPTGRIYLGAAAVGNKIYVLGGSDQNDQVAKNEIYDPATNSWSTGKDMPTAKKEFGIAAVGGRLYAFGGFGNAISLTTDSYIAVSDQWSAKANMQSVRRMFGATASNGKIYEMGGLDTQFQRVLTTSVYDPNADTWTAKANMPTARNHLAAAAVGDNVYAIGGRALVNGVEITAKTLDAYSISQDKWTAKAFMQNARSVSSASVVDGKLYAIGGAAGGNILSSVEVYDNVTDKWSTGPSLPKARYRHTSQVVNGKIYVFGGDTSDASFTDSVLEYSVPNWKLNVSAGAEEGPDTTAPSWSNLSQTSNATTAGKLMRFSVIWSDISSPLQVWFYDSYTDKNSSAQPANSGQKTTYEFDTTGIPDNSYVRWKSYAQDDAGNVGVSNELSFLVTGGPVAPQPNVTENVTQPTVPGADTEDPTSSEILILPTTIDPGMEALIRVRAADNEGLKEAILKVDGDEVKTVPLAGTRDTAEFTWKPDTASKYELEVLIKDVAGNEESVSKSVQVGKVSEPAKPEDSTVFIALGAVLLVIAAVIVLYYLKKKGKLNFGKKKGSEEEEELTAEELGLEGPKY